MIHRPLRLIFMGTPAFAVPSLKSLHESGHTIAAVYTQPPRPAGRGQKETPSPVHDYALAHGLPVFTPVSLKSPEAQAEFVAHKADMAVVAAYGLLLPKAILTACPLGCVNVHPSLLPRWRGAAPIQRTVMAGDKETGIVIMRMDEGLDTGDMLLVERTPIPDGTNAGALHDALAEKAGPLLLKALQGLQDKTITPVKQPASGVTYAKKITKDDCRIDWNRPAQDIRQQILGLSPSPGAFFEHHGEAIKIFDAAYSPSPLGGGPGWGRGEHGSSVAPCPPPGLPPAGGGVTSPGTVIDGRLGIACNPGTLHPLVLQRPGKKRMEAEELLRGFAIPVGTRL